MQREPFALTPYIDRITSGDENHLIVDMSSVPYVSSGGIRALNAAYKVLEKEKWAACAYRNRKVF